MGGPIISKNGLSQTSKIKTEILNEFEEQNM